MKRVYEDKIYVQNKDLKEVLNMSILKKVLIPSTILEKTFNDFNSINDANLEEFVLFDDKESIDFFNKMDFLLDYNEYKDMDINEIFKKGTLFIDERNYLVFKFNNLKTGNNEKFIDLSNKIFESNYKVNTLMDILFYKKSGLDKEFMEDVNPYQKSKKQSK